MFCRECVGDVNAMVRKAWGSVGDGSNADYISDFLKLIVSGLISSIRAEDLCAAAERGNLDAFHELFVEVWFEAYPPSVENTTIASRQGTTFNPNLDSNINPTPSSKPTSEEAVYGNPDYATINGGLQITMLAVRAQDRAGAIYDEGGKSLHVVSFSFCCCTWVN